MASYTAVQDIAESKCHYSTLIPSHTCPLLDDSPSWEKTAAGARRPALTCVRAVSCPWHDLCMLPCRRGGTKAPVGGHLGGFAFRFQSHLLLATLTYTPTPTWIL